MSRFFYAPKMTVALSAIMALSLSACGDDATAENTSAAEEDTATNGEEVGTQDASFLTVATGGSSGAYFQIGATMSDVLGRELNSDTSAQSTGASVENINLISDGNAELALAGGDTIYQAINGTHQFEGEPRDLLSIAVQGENIAHYVVPEDSDIESIEDLAGRNVSVGDVGSATEVNARAVLDAHGLTYDDLNVDYLSSAEAGDQMQNGHIEAAVMTSGLPNPGVVELDTAMGVRILPIEGDGLEAVESEYEYYNAVEIPADVYDTDEDITTVGFTSELLVSQELSEEAVYDITSAIYDNIDAIQSSHSAAADWTLETALEGLAAPLHPGAQRYYEENGIDTD